MRNMGRNLGVGKLRLGHSPSMSAMPETLPFTVDDFSGGYDVSVDREKVPANSSPRMIDMEVDSNNRLDRAPGTTTTHVLTDHATATQLVLHASLNNRSEIVLFDPPYIGIISDVGPLWYDIGLPTGARYTWANFGGTLIFSNGLSRAYARQPEETTIEELADVPPAGAYASFAARIFAGNAIINGNREPLGIAWSAANSDYTDFFGTGSGFELLINDTTKGDRIQAMRTMGLDYMAVLLRNSIWIGSRTGLVTRPADFRVAVPGIGTVSSETVQLTKAGVMFLGDTGVYVFDGTQARLVSKRINRDLLPIDLNNIELYGSMYHPRTKKYYLFTPDKTWIYDLEYDRWYRRSLVARTGTIFAQQFDRTTWGELTPILWGDLGLVTWGSLSPEEGSEVDTLFLSDFAGDKILAKEDYTSMTMLGTAYTPVWESPVVQPKFLNTLVTSKLVNLQYVGSGSVRISLLDNTGEPNLAVDVPLVTTSIQRVDDIPLLHTGRGLGMRLEYLTGRPLVSKVQQLFIPRGPRIADAGITPREFYNDF